MSRKSAVSEDQLLTLHSEMIGTGKTYREIAKENGIVPGTLYNLFRKKEMKIISGKRGRPSKSKEVVAV